jgi:hypothetical protein
MMSIRKTICALITLQSICIFCPGIALSQAESPVEIETIKLVVDKGAPLWLALAKPLPAKHEGETVEARLVEPVYAFDRIVVPAGTQVLGRVSKIQPVSHQVRERAILAGDFTPLRDAQIEFDTLVFKDGTRVPMQTKVSAGLPDVVHLESASADAKKHQSQASQIADMARQEINAKKQEARDAINSPGKMKLIKARALAMLPYHSQTMPAGTRFDAELLAPIDFGTVTCPAQDLVKIGSSEPPVGVVHARLITPLSSATAQRGKPVEAIISQPMYTADHHLILPVGSRLEGTVLQATPARRMNRTGSLRFTFHRAVPPTGLAQSVEGSLSGVSANRDDHIKLDAEGGAHATHPKSGYILPLLDVMLASSTLDGLDHHAHLEHRHYDGPDPGRGATGGIGFGLIGAAAALSSHVAATGFGFWGAGWGVYHRFIARGTEVVFPMDTPMEITLGSHGGKPNNPSSERKFISLN